LYNTRFYFEIVGSNDNFATSTRVFYSSTTSWDNNIIHELVTNGKIIGYIVTQDFTTESTDYDPNAVCEETCFDLAFSPSISKYIEENGIALLYTPNRKISDVKLYEGSTIVSERCKPLSVNWYDLYLSYDDVVIFEIIDYSELPNNWKLQFLGKKRDGTILQLAPAFSSSLTSETIKIKNNVTQVGLQLYNIDNGLYNLSYSLCIQNNIISKVQNINELVLGIYNGSQDGYLGDNGNLNNNAKCIAADYIPCSYGDMFLINGYYGN
jgi:hypothetical protein